MKDENSSEEDRQKYTEKADEMLRKNKEEATRTVIKYVKNNGFSKFSQFVITKMFSF